MTAPEARTRQVMSSNNPEYYRTQAKAMRQQAAEATLDNVRDRCLRSAEAWEDMADRAERHQRSVARTAAAKEAASAALQTEIQGHNDYFR